MSAACRWSAPAIVALACGLVAAGGLHAWAAPFTYKAAGDLKSGSGTGLKTSKNYLPGIRFPIEKAPAYLNSQVYMPGGMYGGGGGQCSSANYNYPWRDNYCEKRSWKMPLCPSGKGHQGQDMRPASCKDNTWWTVAAEAGTITSIGSYSVYLKGKSGTTHRYLHMQMSALAIKKGQKVSKGQKLGRVSNDFGGTSTTIHLHYDVQQYVSGVGTVFVSPYNGLVAAYKALIGQVPTCNASACAAKSKCAAWGACGGFSNACDETGTRKRTCTKWTCAGSKCSSSSKTESQGCKVDTDGKVLQGWGPWQACVGIAGPCDMNGQQGRQQVVCKAGKAAKQVDMRPCARKTEGQVVQDWGPWGPCTAAGNNCQGVHERTQKVCSAGEAVDKVQTEACPAACDTSAGSADGHGADVADTDDVEPVADSAADARRHPVADGISGGDVGADPMALQQVGAAPSAGCNGGGQPSSSWPLLLLTVLVMLALRRAGV